MTEADFANLIHAHSESALQILFGFFSITTAFLAATHLAGKDLTKQLAGVVVALYSFTSIALIGQCDRHLNVVVAARSELERLDAVWHPAVSDPESVLLVFSYAMVVSMAALFVSSIWYFIHARR